MTLWILTPLFLLLLLGAAGVILIILDLTGELEDMWQDVRLALQIRRH